MEIVQCAGPLATGTGSPAQQAVAAERAPAGVGSPYKRWPTSWGDGESCPGGGHLLESACRGWQPPLAWAHQLGGLGVLPRRRSLLKERLLGMASPIGAGPLAREGEFCPGGGHCLKSAYAG